MTLHALTLFPHYTTFVALGAKTVETRPGPFAGNMRPEGVRPGVGGYAVDRLEDLVLVAGRTRPKVGRHQIGPFNVERKRGVDGLLIRSENLAWPYRVPVGHAMVVVKFFGAWPVEKVSFSASEPRWTITDEGLVLPESERALGDYSPGRWALPMGEIRRIDPVPAPGREGVYSLPVELSDKIEGLLSQVTARTIWEYLRTGVDLAELWGRVPEWAIQWVSDVLYDLSSQFDREIKLVKAEAARCARGGAIGPGPYQEPTQALVAGDTTKAEQMIWARLRPRHEWPQRSEVPEVPSVS